MSSGRRGKKCLAAASIGTYHRTGASISIPELSHFATWKFLKKAFITFVFCKTETCNGIEGAGDQAGRRGRFVIAPDSVTLREFSLFSYLLFFLPLVLPWLPVGV
jgi:hypothetical protein